MELTASDKAAFEGRSKFVDHDAVGELHFLGNYLRPLRVGLSRMIENAYDWEHLPYVHPGSFADIALVEEGDWGWRCKTALPNGGGEQLIELLVDRGRHYWATSVVEGPGEGVQIHTQASAVDGGAEASGIEVDVRFYTPAPPETPEQGAMILAVLRDQYARLYDEDEALMLGRQTALDRYREARQHLRPERVNLGPAEALAPGEVHRVELAKGLFLVRQFDGRWLAHSATCPHMLGPLAESQPDAEGMITCPWHGYRFSLDDGEEEKARCAKLKVVACEIEDSGDLVFLA